MLSPPSHIPSDLAFFSHVSFFSLLVLAEGIPSQDAWLPAHDVGMPSLCHSISLSVSLLCFGSRNSYVFLSVLCICTWLFFFCLYSSYKHLWFLWAFPTGDSSFFLRTWLMTPLHIPETPAEYRYNMAHSATHSVIEKTFRTLCSRFRCLDGSKGALQYSPEKSSHIILACCVLHNISLEHGMDVWSFPVTGPVEQPPEEEYEHMESLDLEADRIRQELMLTHFS